MSYYPLFKGAWKPGAETIHQPHTCECAHAHKYMHTYTQNSSLEKHSGIKKRMLSQES